MDLALKVYVALWGTACLAALALYLARRDKYVVSQRAYWHCAPTQSSVLRIAAWGAVFAILAIAAVLIFLI